MRVAGLAVGVAGDCQCLARLGEVLVLDKVGEAIECRRNLFVIDVLRCLAEGGIITTLCGAQENAVGANQ